jgi:hypothetical protein
VKPFTLTVRQTTKGFMQTRAMRATLNKLLQACVSVEEVRAHGIRFGETYGDSVWGCTTIYTHETFSDLYNAHLQRCIDNEEIERENDERKKQIHTEISNCGNLQQFADVEAFVNRFFQEDAQVLWELSEKGQELGHPDYDNGGMP